MRSEIEMMPVLIDRLHKTALRQCTIVTAGCQQLLKAVAQCTAQLILVFPIKHQS